jgi:hypothetical protein
MDQQSLMERIGLPPEGQALVTAWPLSGPAYACWKSLFYDDEPGFFQKISRQKEPAELLLILYIRFAVDLHPDFQARQISDQIYFNTFRDFTVWYRSYFRKTGRPGLTEEKWLALPLKLKIFRLGRLQFEPDGAAIHVHIPEDGKLTPDACSDAFRQADAFFDQSYTQYDCESWLLSPALKELLPPESNILQFQRRFEIQQTIYPFRQAEERIFGKVLKNPKLYPERTALQRSAKAYVLKKGDPGIGYGVINRSIQ